MTEKARKIQIKEIGKVQQMMEFINENIISVSALGVSLVSLFFTIRRELKSIIRISIKPCQGVRLFYKSR